MKPFAPLIVALLISACNQQSFDDTNKNSKLNEQPYQATPTLDYMKLNRMQLTESIKLAKDGNKSAVDKLMDHYLFIGDIENYHMWCYEGARLETVKGLFCAAGIELEQGGSVNCISAIALYKKIALQVGESEAMYYAQLLDLNASKSEITCGDRFWSKTPVKKDMQ
jgi:hypothetical protein